MSQTQLKLKGVGIDMIEINRMKINFNFINRFLADSEIKEFKKLTNDWAKKQFLAGRWALKEAVYKALPFEHLSFKSIVITKNQFQQPETVINSYQICLSLSHNETTAIAIAVVY